MPTWSQSLRWRAIGHWCPDHAFTGEGKDDRDCNNGPELVLIDRKADPETLQLVRFG